MSVPRSMRENLSRKIGVEVSEIAFLVTSRTGTYATALTARGVSQGSIYTSHQTAYDSLTEGQNDVLAVYPGTHDVNLTSHGEDGFLVSKDNTHIVAMYPETIYNGQTRFASQGTTGTNVTMSIQCKESIFMGFNVTNSHSAAGVTAVQLGDGATVAALNNQFKWVGMAGIHGSSALSSATASSLQLYGAASCMFENCQIGDTISKKTASSGQLRFTAVTNGVGNQNNEFRKCRFHSWSNTSGSYLVLHDGANASDRVNLFDDCMFFNFDNGAGKPAAVLHFPAGTPTGYHIVLHNCHQTGSTAWLSATSVATNVSISMHAAEATGGTTSAPT